MSKSIPSFYPGLQVFYFCPDQDAKIHEQRILNVHRTLLEQRKYWAGGRIESDPNFISGAPTSMDIAVAPRLLTADYLFQRKTFAPDAVQNIYYKPPVYLIVCFLPTTYQTWKDILDEQLRTPGHVDRWDHTHVLIASFTKKGLLEFRKQVYEILLQFGQKPTPQETKTPPPPSPDPLPPSPFPPTSSTPFNPFLGVGVEGVPHLLTLQFWTVTQGQGREFALHLPMVPDPATQGLTLDLGGKKSIPLEEKLAPRGLSLHLISHPGSHLGLQTHNKALRDNHSELMHVILRQYDPRLKAMRSVKQYDEAYEWTLKHEQKQHTAHRSQVEALYQQQHETEEAREERHKVEKVLQAYSETVLQDWRTIGSTASEDHPGDILQERVDSKERTKQRIRAITRLFPSALAMALTVGGLSLLPSVAAEEAHVSSNDIHVSQVLPVYRHELDMILEDLSGHPEFVPMSDFYQYEPLLGYLSRDPTLLREMDTQRRALVDEARRLVQQNPASKDTILQHLQRQWEAHPLRTKLYSFRLYDYRDPSQNGKTYSGKSFFQLSGSDRPTFRAEMHLQEFLQYIREWARTESILNAYEQSQDEARTLRWKARMELLTAWLERYEMMTHKAAIFSLLGILNPWDATPGQQEEVLNRFWLKDHPEKNQQEHIQWIEEEASPLPPEPVAEEEEATSSLLANASLEDSLQADRTHFTPPPPTSSDGPSIFEEEMVHIHEAAALQDEAMNALGKAAKWGAAAGTVALGVMDAAQASKGGERGYEDFYLTEQSKSLYEKKWVGTGLSTWWIPSWRQPHNWRIQAPFHMIVFGVHIFPKQLHPTQAGFSMVLRLTGYFSDVELYPGSAEKKSFADSQRLLITHATLLPEQEGDRQHAEQSRRTQPSTLVLEKGGAPPFTPAPRRG